MKLQIDPCEVEIRGQWIKHEGQVVADENCSRIGALVTTKLEKIATDSSGWDTLYRDPSDMRYWELIYPSSDSHGGGPPTLKVIAPPEAKRKYGI